MTKTHLIINTPQPRTGTGTAHGISRSRSITVTRHTITTTIVACSSHLSHPCSPQHCPNQSIAPNAHTSDTSHDHMTLRAQHGLLARRDRTQQHTRLTRPVLRPVRRPLPPCAPRHRSDHVSVRLPSVAATHRHTRTHTLSACVCAPLTHAARTFPQLTASPRGALNPSGALARATTKDERDIQSAPSRSRPRSRPLVHASTTRGRRRGLAARTS